MKPEVIMEMLNQGVISYDIVSKWCPDVASEWYLLRERIIEKLENGEMDEEITEKNYPGIYLPWKQQQNKKSR